MAMVLRGADKLMRVAMIFRCTKKRLSLFLLFAELFALGAGAHRAKVGNAVNGLSAVGPVDFELLVFFEV